MDGQAWGRREEARRAAHLYKQRRRRKGREEQVKMRIATAAAAHGSTLGWEKPKERSSPRESDVA